MSASTTATRSLAIAAGVVFASGALAILFEDVLMKDAPIALKHYLTLVVVSGTMLAGHLAHSAWKHRHFMSCIGFAAIFLAGTALVVYASVGRQGEAVMMSQDEHDKVATERRDLKSLIDTERATIAEKRAVADAECASGAGRKCASARSTVVFYEESAKGLEARLALLKSPKPVAPEAEQLATVASAAFGYDKDQVKGIIILMFPYVTTLFLEFGSIVSLGYGFRPGRRQPSPKAERDPRWLPTPAETAQTSFPVPGNTGPEQPTPPKPGNRRRKPPVEQPLATVGSQLSATVVRFPVGNRRQGGVSEADARSWLLAHIERHGCLPSQDAMATELDVHKGTVAKWLHRWEAEGAIVRGQSGRCKTVRMAAT